jgi:hypothetical protein
MAEQVPLWQLSPLSHGVLVLQHAWVAAPQESPFPEDEHPEPKTNASKPIARALWATLALHEWVAVARRTAGAFIIHGVPKQRASRQHSPRKSNTKRVSGRDACASAHLLRQRYLRQISAVVHSSIAI